MMNSAEKFCTLPPVLPDAFCWSTEMATSPARCTRSPAGRPARAIVERIAFTRSVCWLWPPPLALASTWSCSAWPSGDRPRSCTRLTPETLLSCACSVDTAVTSAGVSAAPDRAATTGIPNRLAVPSGAASFAACSLGALAGRNVELLLLVTLASDGSCVTAANAPTIQARRRSQRKRTAKRPMAPKMASIRIVSEPT